MVLIFRVLEEWSRDTDVSFFYNDDFLVVGNGDGNYGDDNYVEDVSIGVDMHRLMPRGG